MYHHKDRQKRVLILENPLNFKFYILQPNPVQQNLDGSMLKGWPNPIHTPLSPCNTTIFQVLRKPGGEVADSTRTLPGYDALPYEGFAKLGVPLRGSL